MATKKKPSSFPIRKYGDSKAEVEFRSDPFKRLLIFAAVAQRRQDIAGSRRYNAPIVPLSANEQERKDIDAAIALIHCLNNFHFTPDQPSLESLIESAQRLSARHLKPIKNEMDLFEKAITESRKLALMRGRAYADYEKSNVELVRKLGSRMTSAIHAEINRIGPFKLSDESFEEGLTQGREYLTEVCGWSLETFDMVAKDPELALALCRFVFNGATELSLINQGQKSDPQKALQNLPYTSWASEEREFGVDSVLHGFVHHFCEEKEALNRIVTLARMSGLALRANVWGAEAGLALKAMADTRDGSLWEDMPPCGEALLYKQSEGIRFARRLNGYNVRGEAARVGVEQLSDIMAWRSPLVVAPLAEHPGSRLLTALENECRARQRVGPETLGCALSVMAKHPDLKVDVASALASRVAEGFAGVDSAAAIEDLFPELPALIEENQQQSVKANSAMAWVGKTRFEDPMAPVAMAVINALSVEAPNEQALVGEAKRALADRAGLTPGAWRAMSANPALSESFVNTIKALSLSAAASTTSPRKQGARRAAKEVMKLADANGSAFVAKAKAIADQEKKIMPVEAVGRTLSACAKSGIGDAEQQRLLTAVAKSESLALLLSGRLPILPQGWEEGACRSSVFKGDEADRVSALKGDQEALETSAPAWVKGLSFRIERDFKRRQKAGEGDALALEGAIDETLRSFSDWIDCAREQPAGFWAGLDKKDPVSSAARAHEAWSAQLREQQAQSDPNFRLKWPVEAGVMRSERVEAVELSTGGDLFDEGKAMSHCVASYASRCVEGSSRVFSIRVGGARQTTLELIPKGPEQGLKIDSVADRQRVKAWVVNQNRGKHNSVQISPEITQACLEFAKSYTAAFNANTEQLAAALAQEREHKRSASLKAPGI